MCPGVSIRKNEKKEGRKGEGGKERGRKGRKTSKKEGKKKLPRFGKVQRQDSEAFQVFPSLSFHESFSLTDHQVHITFLSLVKNALHSVLKANKTKPKAITLQTFFFKPKYS